MNVLSMNTVDLAEDVRLPLAYCLLAVLERLQGDVDAVQTACFLLKILKEQFDESISFSSSDILHSFLLALSAQAEEFGCARTCLKTLYLLSPRPELVTREDVTLFGSFFLRLLKVLVENQDGPTLLSLIRLCSSFVAATGSSRFKESLVEMRVLLVKYLESPELIEDDLMMEEEDATDFHSAISALATQIENMPTPHIADAENSSSFPSSLDGGADAFRPNDTSEGHCALAETAPAVNEVPESIFNSEDAFASSSALVEVSEGRVMEMMHLIRHFQEHASESFHRAELLQKLFLESSRKVEELLRENTLLKHELGELRRGGRTSVAEVGRFKAKSSVLPSKTLVSQESPESQSMRVLLREKKVIVYIFEAYATRGQLLLLESVMQFSRDFGICPALVSTSVIADVYNESSASGSSGVDGSGLGFTGVSHVYALRNFITVVCSSSASFRISLLSATSSRRTGRTLVPQVLLRKAAQSYCFG
jgi:hypothetical protein